MARWPAKKLTWLDGHGQEEHERERESRLVAYQQLWLSRRRTEATRGGGWETSERKKNHHQANRMVVNLKKYA